MAWRPLTAPHWTLPFRLSKTPCWSCHSVTRSWLSTSVEGGLPVLVPEHELAENLLKQPVVLFQAPVTVAAPQVGVTDEIGRIAARVGDDQPLPEVRH